MYLYLTREADDHLKSVSPPEIEALLKGDHSSSQGVVAVTEMITAAGFIGITDLIGS